MAVVPSLTIRLPERADAARSFAPIEISALTPDDMRQRRWELERADDAARVLVERLEMADRPADVAIVRELRMRLSVDRRANASPDGAAKPDSLERDCADAERALTVEIAGRPANRPTDRPVGER